MNSGIPPLPVIQQGLPAIHSWMGNYLLEEIPCYQYVVFYLNSANRELGLAW